MASLTLEQLWKQVGFNPNPAQREAILHTDGPLLITAGPGSGKTRVLLWRTINLIVFHDIKPEDILLGTFTEKAASQLKHGLSSYLGLVSQHNNKPYDLSRMPLGTIHSICRYILSDRRFSRERFRPDRLHLVDQLDQFFELNDKRIWTDLLAEGEWPATQDTYRRINSILGISSSSKSSAIETTIKLFNRFSEELIDPETAIANCEDENLTKVLEMYIAYLSRGLTDLSLLQKKALQHCASHAKSHAVFRHIIVDEYQDTNTVQERLLFHLAGGFKNLCVVGDDDQALYRFRGATVENLVEFRSRCDNEVGVIPKTVNLSTNYRSRKGIVDFYKKYISKTDWAHDDGDGSYRIEDKKINAFNKDKKVAVIASDPANPYLVCDEVADLAKSLITSGKVRDPNEIAFLYPSLMGVNVGRMIEALARRGLKVHAPRAKNIFESDEIMMMIGLMTIIFGTGDSGEPKQGSYQQYYEWLHKCQAMALVACDKDPTIKTFIESRRSEIDTAANDYKLLKSGFKASDLKKLFKEDHIAELPLTSGLSPKPLTFIAKRLRTYLSYRQYRQNPATVQQVLVRMTSLTWGTLDLFYQLLGLKCFKKTIEYGASGVDEGPMYALSKLSDFISRYQSKQGPVINGHALGELFFQRSFFSQFLYNLYRQRQTEHEDKDNPFPKGRIPFLTIHQSKGLEFPVVVLGDPRKRGSVQQMEHVIRPLLTRSSEPIDRIGDLDLARLYYVALSRPQNLLVLCNYNSRGNALNPEFASLVSEGICSIKKFDVSKMPEPCKTEEEMLPKTFSYTADFQVYDSCPRRYMAFRKFKFVPSRTQMAFFGQLVHQTIEDLHNWIKDQIEHDPGDSDAEAS